MPNLRAVLHYFTVLWRTRQALLPVPLKFPRIFRVCSQGEKPFRPAGSIWQRKPPARSAPVSSRPAPLRVTQKGPIRSRHPELVEGSLLEYRHYYHRDPSTSLRSAQDDTGGNAFQPPILAAVPSRRLAQGDTKGHTPPSRREKSHSYQTTPQTKHAPAIRTDGGGSLPYGIVLRSEIFFRSLITPAR